MAFWWKSTASPISWRARPISRNWCTISRCTSPPPTRKFIRKEDVPAEALDKERDIQRGRDDLKGKPANVIDRIVEGRMAKFYEEVCLLEQPFVKEASLTVGQLIKTKISKLGENISVSRFTRYKVGDIAAIESGGEGPPDASAAV